MRKLKYLIFLLMSFSLIRKRKAQPLKKLDKQNSSSELDSLMHEFLQLSIEEKQKGFWAQAATHRTMLTIVIALMSFTVAVVQLINSQNTVLESLESIKEHVLESPELDSIIKVKSVAYVTSLNTLKQNANPKNYLTSLDSLDSSISVLNDTTSIDTTTVYQGIISTISKELGIDRVISENFLYVLSNYIDTIQSDIELIANSDKVLPPGFVQQVVDENFAKNASIKYANTNSIEPTVSSIKEYLIELSQLRAIYLKSEFYFDPTWLKFAWITKDEDKIIVSVSMKRAIRLINSTDQKTDLSFFNFYIEFDDGQFKTSQIVIPEVLELNDFNGFLESHKDEL